MLILVILLMIFFAFLPSKSSWAGMAPEDWAVLPQVDFLYFTKDQVGLITNEDEYFVISPDLKAITKKTRQEFQAQFPTTTPLPREILDNRGVGSEVLLRTSSGESFKTTDAYCSEGAAIHHELWKGEKKLNDFIDPCVSISSLEKVGDQLWMGTYRRVEHGYGAGNGVVIVRADGSEKLAQITDELTGDLIRSVRKNPYDGNVWIMTHLGISVVSPDFKVLRSAYLFQGFNSETGLAEIKLSPHFRKSDPLAEVSKRLHLKNPKAFFRTLQKIERTREEMFAPSFHAHVHGPNLNDFYVPPAWNALVPFFLEALRSSDTEARSFAVDKICLFNDSRAIEMVSRMLLVEGEERTSLWSVRRCFTKYAADHLIPVNLLNEIKPRLLDRVKRSLKEAGTPSRKDWNTLQSLIVGDVETLRDLDDFSGWEAINAYFQESAGTQANADLFRMVLRDLEWKDLLTPTVVLGMHRFRFDSGAIRRGCLYFDLTYEFSGRSLENRRGAEHVKLMVSAVTDFVEHQKYPQKNVVKNKFGECAQALYSQLKDAKVKKEVNVILSTLTPKEKAIFSQLKALGEAEKHR